METLTTFLRHYQEQYGYVPTNYELVDLYRQGHLLLTDSQEDAIIDIMETLNL